MPKKARKEKGSDVSITSFLFSSDEGSIKPNQVTAEPQRDLENELISMVSSRGGLSKEELMSWGKERGLTTAKLLSMVEQLTEKRVLVKRLDDKGKLIYKVDISKQRNP